MATRTELVEVRADSTLLADVIELGDRNKKTLGLLPREAYAWHASRGLIVAAMSADSDRLLGYALFRLPRDVVSLTHLVVADGARGQGLARFLVDHLSNKYGARRGIRAKCRRDWPAHKMWPHLGFVARGDVRGRSNTGAPLTVWWRDHGHADLMTWDGGHADVVSVVMDVNVFLDLHDPDPAAAQVLRTKTILQGTLADRIELVITPELHNEIDRQGDPHKRARLHRAADTYAQLAVRVESADAVARALESAAGRRSRQSDISDVRHVAYAASGGVRVVVTNDERAVRRLQAAAREIAGVELVTPEDLVRLIDQISDAPAYAPSALLGTGYSTVEAVVHDESTAAFLATGSGETVRSYRWRLRRLSGLRPRSHTVVIHDPAGAPTALVGYVADGKFLDVPLLRIARGPVKRTLAVQLLHRLRALAIQERVSAVRLTDPFLDGQIVEAAEGAGYQSTGGSHVALIVRGCQTSLAVSQAVAAMARDAEAAPQFEGLVAALERLGGVDQDAHRRTALAIEQRVHPVVLADADLPCFLVPIRAQWASALFGIPEQLFARPDFLGISVEHVYYRASRPAPETAPARVLWYVSTGGPIEHSIVAWSHLIDVVEGSPDDVWREFKRLGTYERDQVRAAAGSAQRVRALRVTSTRILDTPVSLARYRALAASFCHTVSLQSPHRITNELFVAVVEEGTNARAGQSSGPA